MYRAKGDPKGIIQEALLLREKTHDLRAWLRQKAESADITTSKGQFRADLELREFLLPIEQELGLTGKPRLRDALEIGFDVGIPSAGVSPKALLDWAVYQWDRRQINILTDLSIDAAFDEDDAMTFWRFVDNCSGRK